MDNKIAYIWFNGPSAVPLHNIPQHDLEIGCNFILKHRRVNHVCAYDQQVIDQIKKKIGFDPDVQYWTRRNYATDKFKTFDVSNLKKINTLGFDSGTLAINLALYLDCTGIYLFGFDWHLTNESIYDKKYVWRNGMKPIKFTAQKKDFLEQVGEKIQLNIVHDQVREKYANVNWIPTKDFTP